MKKIEKKIIETSWLEKPIKPRSKPEYRSLPAAILANNIGKTTDQCIPPQARPSQQKTLRLKNLRPKV